MSEQRSFQLDNLTQSSWKKPGVHTMPVCTVAQIRELEHVAFQQVDSFCLMQAAGLRSAAKIQAQQLHAHPHPTQCVVFAGPGNNGGDALIVAGELQRLGEQVVVYEITLNKPGSSDRQRAKAWCEAQGLQITALHADTPLPALPIRSVIIDGLLGIACTSAPSGELARAIAHINAHHQLHVQSAVYALDCPSGLNCDTGNAPGQAIQASTTLSYIACKTGLLTDQGKRLAGDVWVEPLNCEPLFERIQPPPAIALGRVEQLSRLPSRGHEHHKGHFGSLAVVGGQEGMVGAAVLAARTALICGAGRVAFNLLCDQDKHMPDVQLSQHSLFFDFSYPELMNKSMAECIEFADTWIVGPGLGQSDAAADFLHEMLSGLINQQQQNSAKPLNMVWDADGLNCLAHHTSLQTSFQQLIDTQPNAHIVFTPHPLEAARLLAQQTAQIQADRLASAQAIARKFHCTVALKGAGTVISDGVQTEINTTGGPALATGGSGDVLAGAVAALLGQGLNARDAASLATYLHGLTVDPLPHEHTGLLISRASDIASRLAVLLNHFLNQSARRNGELA